MKKLIIVIILMITGLTHAQINLTGVVKDSIGNPLEMANVMAINAKTKKVDSYGFTNSKGQYKLSLKKNASFSVKISYVGLKTADFIIDTKEDNIIKNIILRPDNELDGITIVSKMPVTIKGDTIIYNADSFTSGTEKKLGDVLKKMPGIEVNADGEIEVEGKKVSKVMVDGKDFFDGDTKLAVKNIPANAIDKVQVLKNHSDVSQMSRVTDNEDNIVINIKLKEGKKNFWFGEITAGAGVGTDSRYLVHPKLFYYSPKYSVNIITDMNNIGEVSFTRRDYFKFSGGFRGVSRNSGTNFNVASSDIGFLTMRNNKAKEIDTKFGAVNFSYAPKKTWDISGFAIYSGTKTDMEQTTTRNYIKQNANDTTPETTEEITSATSQESNLGLFKLSSKYKPNGDNQFDYDLFVKISNQKENQQKLSVTNNGLGTITNNTIVEMQEQNPFSVIQNANYYYTLNEKNIFAFEGQFLTQDEDPFYNAELTNLPVSFANTLTLTNPGGNPFDISQNKRVKTNKLDAKLDYYYVINSKSNVNITLGATISNQKFNSSIFETLNNVRNDITTPTTLNDVSYSFNDMYAGLHYKFITGIFTFNQGFSLHNYSAKNTQLGAVVNHQFNKVLPDASIKVSLKKSETLRLNYKMQVDFTDINQVAEGFVFNNYNRLYSGNKDLENSLSHNVNLSYFSFNMFNYTNVFAFINYNKRIDGITGSTRLLGINQSSTTINSAFPSESLSVSGRFGKTFGKLKVSLGGNASLSKSNSLLTTLQDTDNDPTTPKVLLTTARLSKSFSKSLRTKLSSNFRDAPNFDIGYNVSFSNYNNGGLENKFVRHSPYLNVDAYFLKSFIFTSKYTYNNYKSNGTTINNYSFWDADLSYQKEDSKWEYKVEVKNILDTKSLNDNNSSAIYSSTTNYIIQPRYIVFSVKYDL